MAPKTAHLTAFTNPRTGISYSWKILPFGLSLSAVAFLYVMSQVLQNREKFNFLFYYVHDLAIASRDFWQHVTHLKTVFSTIRANNLSMNPTKTTVAYPEIDFLGHTVNAEGVKISPSKIKVIKNLQAPVNRKGHQRTLGLLQFFRRHIPNFSKRTFNMRQLLKQGAKFEWSNQCDKELAELKGVLINNPVLQPIREDRPIYLYIDGSIKGVGSAIVQYDDLGRPSVCSYLSHATTETQQKWCPYQLEMLALGLSLRAHETLFLGSEINVFTDNAIILNIAKYQAINNREKRLLAYISQFRLKIRYIPGRDNKLADMLSRIPEDLNNSQVKDFYPPARQADEEFILPILTPDPLELPVQANLEDMDTDNSNDLDSPISEDNPRPWTTYTFESLGSSPRANGNSQFNPEAPVFHPRCRPDMEVTPTLAAVVADEPTLRRSARIAERIARQEETVPPSAENVNQELAAEAAGENQISNEEDFVPTPPNLALMSSLQSGPKRLKIHRKMK